MSRYFAELDRRVPAGFPADDAIDTATASFNPPRGSFVLATEAGATVGCGAVTYLSPTTAEIKRMWVAEGERGRHLGRRLLQRLEGEARSAGRTTAVLDTNATLLEAVALYESAGYRRVGRYNANPHADLWFAKPLA